MRLPSSCFFLSNVVPSEMVMYKTSSKCQRKNIPDEVKQANKPLFKAIVIEEKD